MLLLHANTASTRRLASQPANQPIRPSPIAIPRVATPTQGVTMAAMKYEGTHAHQHG